VKGCRFWVGVLIAAATAGAPPAEAQQSIGGWPATVALPPYPTQAGKPLIYDPAFIAKSDDDKGCAPGFSCRLRLLGVIQNKGVVELRATAFTW
jgi:hypothetical protein